MTPTCRRYLIALSLGIRFTLGTVNGAAAQGPESAPSLSPPAPAVTRPASSRSAGADDSVRSGQLVNGPPLSLYHGEVQVLDLADVTRIAVGNGAVLRAQVVAASQVVLIGEAAGTTSLRVWTRSGTQFNYQVAVRAFDVSQIVRDVQDLLAGEPDISVRQVDGHVLIEGDYTNARAASRLEALQKIYPQIVSTVPVRKAAAPPEMDRMVYMDVRVVEIMKSTLRRLGVNWASQATGPSVGLNVGHVRDQPAIPNGTLLGIATNLTSLLDVLEQSGESWTLAEPTVSCKSGGSAKFTVGGEIPVPVAAGLGTSTVIYKDYGVILEFKPVADNQGNVSSTLVAEVSEPDQSLSNLNNNGLIAFTKTRTETEISLKENETLVISGLLKNNGSQAVNGIPGAKEIPVLGRLFKSQQFQNDRTELVVLVTPRAVDAQRNAAAIRQADQIQSGVDPVISRINGRPTE